jgi:hypothetical protein
MVIQQHIAKKQNLGIIGQWYQLKPMKAKDDETCYKSKQQGMKANDIRIYYKSKLSKTKNYIIIEKLIKYFIFIIQVSFVKKLLLWYPLL